MIGIYHSRDLDGWMSAAIIKKWFETQSFLNEGLTLIGWDYGDKIPSIGVNESVIMADVSFDIKTMQRLTCSNDLVWIDHHISAIKEAEKANINPHGIRNDKFAACELSWEYLFGTKIPEIVRLLGRYDCFEHKGTSEEKTVLEFQYASRAKITNQEDAFNWLSQWTNVHTQSWIQSGKDIYSYLCIEAKQIYERRITVDFDGYKFAVVNAARFNPINFGIDYHNDKADDIYFYDGAACFHYEKGLWNFSLYNDNGQVDCSEICKKRGGGGHKGAAGFRTGNIMKIIKA